MLHAACAATQFIGFCENFHAITHEFPHIHCGKNIFHYDYFAAVDSCLRNAQCHFG